MNHNEVEKLYETTDAYAWAETFMDAVNQGAVVDIGRMVGWFANAIETAKRITAEENVRVRSALERLVDLKDGLHDSVYLREKPRAWARARDVLGREDDV